MVFLLRNLAFNSSMASYKNCPVTKEKYTNPMLIKGCGHTIDKSQLDKVENGLCPVCNVAFGAKNVIPNYLIAHLNNIKIEDEVTNTTKAKKIIAKGEKDYSLLVADNLEDCRHKINSHVGYIVSRHGKRPHYSYGLKIGSFTFSDTITIDIFSNLLVAMLTEDGYKVKVQKYIYDDKEDNSVNNTLYFRLEVE